MTVSFPLLFLSFVLLLMVSWQGYRLKSLAQSEAFLLRIETGTGNFFLLPLIMSLNLDIPFLSSKVCPKHSCRIVFHWKMQSS